MLGAFTYEPAIAQAPDGTIFVAGPNPPPGTPIRELLWSTRDGEHWVALDNGGLADAAIGNSDTDLAVGADGTLYQVAMTWLPAGYAISVGVRPPGAARTAWQPLDVEPWVDRPWVAVAPDGAVHAVWCNARGAQHAVSRDRGVSWTMAPSIEPAGDTGGFAIGPRGELAVRLGPLRAPTGIPGLAFVFPLRDPSVDGVAVSTDGGASWAYCALPGDRPWPDELNRRADNATPRYHEPVAFDDAGTLYAAWAEGVSLTLARSRDLGATWSTIVLPANDGARFPFLRGGTAGNVAATWMTAGSRPAAHLAHIQGADGPAPLLRATEVPLAHDAGEYVEAALLDGQRVAAAVPLAGSDDAHSGFVFVRENRAR